MIQLKSSHSSINTRFGRFFDIRLQQCLDGHTEERIFTIPPLWKVYLLDTKEFLCPRARKKEKEKNYFATMFVERPAQARKELGKAKQGDEKTADLERRAADFKARVQELEVLPPRFFLRKRVRQCALRKLWTASKAAPGEERASLYQIVSNS